MMLLETYTSPSLYCFDLDSWSWYQEADDATTFKPDSEHPAVKWIFTTAGVAKRVALKRGTAIRDPDTYDMHA